MVAPIAIEINNEELPTKNLNGCFTKENWSAEENNYYFQIAGIEAIKQIYVSQALKLARNLFKVQVYNSIGGWTTPPMTITFHGN